MWSKIKKSMPFKFLSRSFDKLQDMVRSIMSFVYEVYEPISIALEFVEAALSSFSAFVFFALLGTLIKNNFNGLISDLFEGGKKALRNFIDISAFTGAAYLVLVYFGAPISFSLLYPVTLLPTIAITAMNKSFAQFKAGVSNFFSKAYEIVSKEDRPEQSSDARNSEIVSELKSELPAVKNEDMARMAGSAMLTLFMGSQLSLLSNMGLISVGSKLAEKAYEKYNSPRMVN